MNENGSSGSGMAARVIHNINRADFKKIDLLFDEVLAVYYMWTMVYAIGERTSFI